MSTNHARLLGCFRCQSQPTNQPTNQRKTKMTKEQFNSLCAMYYIYPAIALENELIQSALFRDASIDEIEEILESEF